ncbi:hypothetical protein BSF41_02970 [Flavobacterium sp. ACN2]|nr:hypothetical protein BSF41_02970 [Flavobacterium sp. ACN2]
MFCYNQFYSQNVYDYKVKTVSNVKDRTKILDVLRSKLKKDYDQEFVFVVSQLNVSERFAWFNGYVHRKDGEGLLLEPGEDSHITALLQKKGNQWNVLKMEVFIKEVEWEDFLNKTKAPKKIFLY